MKLHELDMSDLSTKAIPNNENSDACTKCGGICCHNMGCEIWPSDVKRWFKTDNITVEIITKLLDTGYVGLDW